MKQVLIILSGGLDSTVMLANAVEEGCLCETLSFDYGQRHRLELRAARTVARFYGVSNRVIKIDSLSSARSSLVSNIKVPKGAQADYQGTPLSTYVPARNTLFIAYALAQAEILALDEIHFGANKDDYPAYPDCNPAFFQAFQQLIDIATTPSPPKLITPLIKLTKRDIVALGQKLQAPLHLTLSCYDPLPRGEHCGECLACRIRNDAFSMQQ